MIRSLLRVLENGAAAKAVLDIAINANSAMQNLREAIAGVYLIICTPIYSSKLTQDGGMDVQPRRPLPAPLGTPPLVICPHLVGTSLHDSCQALSVANTALYSGSYSSCPVFGCGMCRLPLAHDA